ncbi:hypothetical protein AQJ91_34175 [Streptomyces dysideae]|uniref:Uncharacterized protein n=2 Tax=Streptomyces dysideae TaxID=909626 RepID=A0A101UU21_9ACTN|nr:hypothetical protein AQJ91_34175 [Streptomyces dysideae]
MGKGAQSMPLEVQHLKRALLREFQDRISMEDFEQRDPTERETALLSRPVSAKAARILADCTSDEAAAWVIDGWDDFGIDCVAFSASGSELWLIQAKWKDTGTAGFDDGGGTQAGTRTEEARTTATSTTSTSGCSCSRIACTASSGSLPAR